MGWRFKEPSKEELLEKMSELRPLPLGRSEFEAWSDRIIDEAMVPADRDSQKFALADMIMHLNPTEDHKEDAHFIKYLRKAACNQVAHAMMTEYRDKAKARLAEEESKKVKLEVVQPPPLETNAKPEILANSEV